MDLREYFGRRPRKANEDPYEAYLRVKKEIIAEDIGKIVGEWETDIIDYFGISDGSEFIEKFIVEVNKRRK